MSIVSQDILMRQIESLAGSLARLAIGGDQTLPAQTELMDAGDAAGLSIEVAASLPAPTVAGLLGHDPERMTIVALALGRMAWSREEPSLARKALWLLDQVDAPGLDLGPARGALLALAED